MNERQTFQPMKCINLIVQDEEQTIQELRSLWFFFYPQKYANEESLYAGGSTPSQRKRKSEVSSCRTLTLKWLDTIPSAAISLSPTMKRESISRNSMFTTANVNIKHNVPSVRWISFPTADFQWLLPALTTHGLSWNTVFIKPNQLRATDWIMLASQREACASLFLLC